MVSQQVEHGKFGDLDRVELRLRLAELEALVNLMPKLTSDLEKSS